MTDIEKTALARLEREGRLLNAVLKGPLSKPGSFGFRGDIALKFQAQLADEKRPPEYCMEQVITYAVEGEKTLPMLAGYLHNFAYLEDVVSTLGDMLSADGVYFMFCNNVDLLAKFRVKLGEATFIILPCDESTVWKELMEISFVDKNDIKKLDTAGKTEYLIEAAKKFSETFDLIAFQDGVARMEPVKNRNENRPV
jgi:hypothetical protein